MPLFPRRWKPSFTLSLLVSGVLACTGIMENEFDCENAIAHLESCCPAYANARYLSCTQGHGCDATSPDLDVPLSQCIQAQSCNALQTSDACSGNYGICGVPPSAAPSPPDPGGNGGSSSGGFSSSGGDDASDDGGGATDDGSGGDGGGAEGEAGADDAPAGNGEAGE